MMIFIGMALFLCGFPAMAIGFFFSIKKEAAGVAAGSQI